MPTPDTYPEMFIGYCVIWGLVVLFCLLMGLKQKRLGDRIRSLEEKISIR